MNRLSSLSLSRVLLLLCFLCLAGTTLAQGDPPRTSAGRAPSAVQLGLPSPEELAADLLQQFETIYNGRDAEGYDAMFDRWDFSYEFSPLDRNWGAPEAWGYADEVETARRMFEDPMTTEIDLRLEMKEVAPTLTTLPGGQNPEPIWKVTASAFLKVERMTLYGTETNRIIGHLHEFYFRRGAEDEGRAWKIVYWRDLTGRSGGSNQYP